MDFKTLKKMEEAVRIGGNGSMRRKHKKIPSLNADDEKRVRAALAMLPLKNLGEIQEMTIKFSDSSEVVVIMPRIQKTNPSYFFVMSGHFVRKSLTAGPSKAPKAPKPHKPKSFSDKKAESGESIKMVAKKPKNKEEAAMAGGDSEPKLSNGKSILISSEDGSDPDNEKVPSDESDVDRTVVCAKDSLRSFGDDSDGK
uniref:Transcription factor BTF3 n=2 Tax=Drosophila melanogaster TaxID=7227 RepID=Q9VY38_DROME|nr:Nascent-associated complex beta-subunit-like, testis 2 [Drosophila melanogaster]AAF48367.1 Nascent-associated complex beta-subunit-like, testis 2 [Drosophila melanogaster]AOQ13277.1 betaNACtes2-PA [synthetic construct]|eukprot:NP_727777.1 Nascent-associated complex beta-subunit-like, testis 2 [Drosophila melanogaster]